MFPLQIFLLTAAISIFLIGEPLWLAFACAAVCVVLVGIEEYQDYKTRKAKRKSVKE